MIDPSSTFFYEFAVENSGSPGEFWTGHGFSKAVLANFEGLAGTKPRFELSFGWLSLLPTEGWTRSLPIRAFSDQRKRWEMGAKEKLADIRTHSELYNVAQQEATKEASEKASMAEDPKTYREHERAALARALRRCGLTRDLASFSLLVGDALSRALRPGDSLQFSRDGNGDFRYSVLRNAETVFSAGSLGRSDPGGAMAVWQEYDSYPNPNAEAIKKRNPMAKVMENITKHRDYVTARINEKQFQLRDGQDAHSDPYYVFLARSNAKVPPIAFEFTPRAVHSAGRLDMLSKDQITDAACKLTAPEVIML